jgi:hypothetical protein
MRKTTLLWLVLSAFCGTVLFHTSQKVHDEREKIAALDANIAKEEESLRVLNAEWSYLNQPARLEKLAKTYLNMAPLKGSQFIKVEDIPLRGAVVAEAVTTTPAPIIKIKDNKQPRHPGLVPGSGRLSSRLIESQDAQTRFQTPEQVRGGDATKSVTNTRSFGDLMKNLHAGVE